MNNIKITTELSQEDRKLLEDLMGSVTLLASVLGSMQPKKINQETTLPDHPADTTAAHLEPVDAPAPAPVEPDPVEETPKVEVIPYAEFQAAVTRVVAKGPDQKEAAKAIINKYAKSVSAIPEAKRAEVMAELAKI